MSFQKWKDYNEIIHSVQIICFNRKDYYFTPFPGMCFTWVEDFKIDISSKKIRNDIAIGALNVNDLTLSVKDYIFENNLYSNI